MPLEVTKAAIDVWGADRVGYRISPNGIFNSMSDSDPVRTFSYLTGQLNKLGIVYLHVVDPMADGAKRVSPLLRRKFDRSYIVNGGFRSRQRQCGHPQRRSRSRGFRHAVSRQSGFAEAYRIEAPLNVPDQATFYAGEDRGFTDYQALT